MSDDRSIRKLWNIQSFLSNLRNKPWFAKNQVNYISEEKSGFHLHKMSRKHFFKSTSGDFMSGYVVKESCNVSKTHMIIIVFWGFAPDTNKDFLIRKPNPRLKHLKKKIPKVRWRFSQFFCELNHQQFSMWRNFTFGALNI